MRAFGAAALCLLGNPALGFKGSVTSELSDALKRFGAPLRTVGLVTPQAGGELARALCGELLQRVTLVPAETSDSPALAVIDVDRSVPSCDALEAVLASDVVVYAVAQHELDRRGESSPYLLALLGALEHQLELYAVEGPVDASRRKTVVLACTDSAASDLGADALLDRMRADVERMWAGVSKPAAFAESALEAVFDVRYALLPHAKYAGAAFGDELDALKRSALFAPAATSSLAGVERRARNAARHFDAEALAARRAPENAEVRAFVACEAALDSFADSTDAAVESLVLTLTADAAEPTDQFLQRCDALIGDALRNFDAAVADAFTNTDTFSRKRSELVRSLAGRLAPLRSRRVALLANEASQRASKAGSALRVKPSLQKDTERIVADALAFFDARVAAISQHQGLSPFEASSAGRAERRALDQTLTEFFRERLVQLQLQGSYVPAKRKLWPFPVALQLHWLVPALGREASATGLTAFDRKAFNINAEGDANGLNLPIPDAIKKFAKGLVARDPSTADVVRDDLADV
ncbi:hypothetical protein M885DRAFT_586544 [Pelagophyceae sp. CCMP2097]|nr:hypothetical protein M885DRAFT_586544 [Pelagophyceae sp. CCMP2097]